MNARAQGCYRYWLDDDLQPITEPFAITSHDTIQRLRGQRIVDGRTALDIQADFESGACTQFDLSWNAPLGDPERTWRYRLDGKTLHWQPPGQPTQRLTVPPDGLLFPLLRAATGPILARLSRQPGTLALPCLRDPNDTDAFLKPLLSPRRAVASTNGEHFRYYGGEYGAAGADYWCNPLGLVQRYRWASPHGTWEVRLEDCDHSPDFIGFGSDQDDAARS